MLGSGSGTGTGSGSGLGLGLGLGLGDVGDLEGGGHHRDRNPNLTLT